MIVGILGGGQLGRMLALEGYPLGLQFAFLEPKDDPCVSRLGRLVSGGYDDPEALRRLAAEVDVVTYEFENVPVASARLLRDEGLEVHPTPRALEMAQDRLEEKRGFEALDIPVAAYRPVETRDELESAVSDLGGEGVLKIRSGGYDGKGQELIRSEADVAAAWDSLGGRPLILEQLVPFDRELSVVAVRGKDGSRGCYPLVENIHRDGILRTTLAPADEVGAELQKRAEGYVFSLLDELDYVGVVAVELFQVGDRLLANEMAPRVHNSGHWTLDGAHHSQFENHLRAVCGLPLGRTEPRGHSAMHNFLGSVPDPRLTLAIPGLHLHDYRKSPRPLRKVGHCTITGSDRKVVLGGLDRLRAVVGGG